LRVSTDYLSDRAIDLLSSWFDLRVRADDRCVRVDDLRVRADDAFGRDDCIFRRATTSVLALPTSSA
jgi:hypothetical protein